MTHNTRSLSISSLLRASISTSHQQPQLESLYNGTPRSALSLTTTDEALLTPSFHAVNMSRRTRPSRACAAPVRSRAARTNVSYREPSSEESLDELDIESPKAKVVWSSTRAPVKGSSTAGAKRKRSVTPRVLLHTSGNKTKKSAKGKETVNNHTYEGLMDSAVIPAWNTLPYEILLQIFMHASHPVYDDWFVPSPSAKWLVGVSLICKSFSEPALTALYRSLPLSDDPYSLLDLLVESSATHMFNYNSKVQRLEIEVSRTLAYTFPGHGHFDLGALIRLTPQLRDLSLYHVADHPKCGRIGTVARAGKWTYQDSIFDALKEKNIRLRSWRWNTRMVSTKQSLSWIRNLHQTAPFQALKRLTFVNYLPAKRRPKDDSVPTDEGLLADALSVLPRIEELEFESCEIVNQCLMPLLPFSLLALTIRNCSALTSEIFHPFLITHGSLLKELVLDHNQSLSLSFLTSLATSCPHLEVLKMDLLYYSSHVTFSDSEPKYEDLLLPDEAPTWPPTLRTLHLVQLRNWDASTAEMFFQSLLDSAPVLPDLRRLVLKAILKIGWRDRASFRDKWIGRLRRVFLRPPEPLNTDVRALEVADASGNDLGVHDRRSSTRGSNTRRESAGKVDTQHGIGRVLRQRTSRISTFSRVEVTSRPDDISSDSDVPLVPKRKSTRLSKHDEDEYALPTSPESARPQRRHGRETRTRRLSAVGINGSAADPTSTTLHRSDWENKTEEFVQAMCEVVEVRIDNLRPMEEQLNENDFLDEEASGDEDWDGDDAALGDSAYAW